MTNPPGTPPDPQAPKVVHTSQTIVRERTAPAVIVEDNSSKKAWIAGLSVLGLCLVVGLMFMANHDDTPPITDVTVNSAPATPLATTTVVATEVVDSNPEDVTVFVTNTERSIERLSRPDDAANQAELAAMRRRMEDLRQADAAQAQAIRQELQASVARLEAQAAAAPAQTVSTTVSTSDSGTTVTSETQAVTTQSAVQPAVDSQAMEAIEKRLEATSLQLGQLESTAAPAASSQLQGLNEDLASLRTKLSQAASAPPAEQATLISEVESELANLETAISAVPIQ